MFMAAVFVLNFEIEEEEVPTMMAILAIRFCAG